MICAYVSHPQSASAQSARAVTNHFGSVVAFFGVSLCKPSRRVARSAQAAAQRAFSHRARMNGLATRGEWKADLEKKAA